MRRKTEVMNEGELEVGLAFDWSEEFEISVKDFNLRDHYLLLNLSLKS